MVTELTIGTRERQWRKIASHRRARRGDSDNVDWVCPTLLKRLNESPDLGIRFWRNVWFIQRDQCLGKFKTNVYQEYTYICIFFINITFVEQLFYKQVNYNSYKYNF